mmetsp:Transcript_7386/g.9989  ORF Transcript_7386/g.9989 Transcript_7386/m.9989 type:complete len:407 (+) Transcript_7386:25-1245(+)|eukprot:CAMPEP_0196580274 /NCGR_PEP_ID=MMETSP1081-20130531/28167_1 /TAXON_ID=36882 /ORGANISM="Pyramimonas amylifera, Strain CCMP720" /LENGTH=406 /DNA_ID=CAMNT_0041900107 /DNA_START=25 /DNA_END=1245 /DNA_ORIENTATION=+
MEDVDAAIALSLLEASCTHTSAQWYSTDEARLEAGLLLSSQHSALTQRLSSGESAAPLTVFKQHTWRCHLCAQGNTVFCLKCGRCGTASASGGSILPLPEMGFGVELELYMPHSSNWSEEDVASCLKHAGIPCVFESYTHRVTPHWKIVKDSSIRAERHQDLSFELVSPILVGEDGVFETKRVLDVLFKLGVEVNNTTGLHVHMGADQFTPEQLRKIAANFLKYEAAFDCMMSSGRRAVNSSFAKSNRVEFGTLSGKQRNNRIFATRTVEELIDLVNPSEDRYFKLNLQPVHRASPTIEFRQHGGAYEEAVVLAWIRTLIQFSYVSAMKPQLEYFSEVLSAQEELMYFFSELVLDETLCDFYLSRVGHFGMDHLDLRPWKCQTCDRDFITSRSLMQHISDKHVTED